MKSICITTFIIYHLIATFFLCNILFNPRINLTLVNKKTKEEKDPTISFLCLYCLLWIFFIPISIYKGEE